MKKLLSIGLFLALMGFTTAEHEEGIFPLSELSNLELEKAGLKIAPSEIYNEDGGGLVNALVRLGGCTGSFISDKGLIITNHHCVYGTVASLSTPENNYLENGFYASSFDKELKTSLPCKITLSFEDVSAKMLAGVDGLGALEKKAAMRENRKAIIEEEQSKHPELLIEVSEMLVGKVYTLFRYKELKDVRIVYAPPKNIGKFGGETDNWEWPRHNGDFSIVRAYENGQPYQPEQHLQVSTNGTREGDFTFILGYPGRTYRNQPAEFLEYQNDYILPIIADWFDYRIKAIEDFIGDDVAKKLKYSGTLASLNNVSKNFKGKMQGLRRTDVIKETYEGQALLKKFAEQNPVYSEYVPLFDKSEELHKRKFELITDNLYISQLYRTSSIFSAAFNIVEARRSLDGMSKKEFNAMVEEDPKKDRKKYAGLFSLKDELPLDQQLFTELVYRIAQTKLPELKAVLGPELAGQNRDVVSAYMNGLYKKSRLCDTEKSEALYERNPHCFVKSKDPIVDLVDRIQPVYLMYQMELQQVNAEIDEIIPKFNDLEMARNSGEFIPDANGTLRFTYGYVKGYEPEDAKVYSPFTTISGILEKTIGSTEADYFLQEEIIEKLQKIEPADVLKNPKNGSVVVCFLYNMDTTGGNSGSPIMDAYGRLVGVNFDRSYTATINDYAWDESYSRSIGVDIRYVLYIMKYFGEADEVLEEMNVEL